MKIKVEGLEKSYNNRAVLHNLNFTLGKGIYFLTGKTGAGKTTLLRILAGLEKADGGHIEYDGVNRLAMVFQENRLFENLSLRSNIEYTRGDKVPTELAKELGLEEYLDMLVKELSGGTKRRGAIMRALGVDWDWLILDEPFTGMDYSVKIPVMNGLLNRAEQGIIIVATHDKDALEFMGNKIKIIEVN